MDAFYASVEQRDDPSLVGKPVIVGWPSLRSVVCTASYEARPFGVRSAMSMSEAMRRCPQGIVIPPRMQVYAEVSTEVMKIFHRYSPLVEPLSLDEAFVDVTESRALFGDGETIARRIQREIAEELRLSVSLGVAPSKFVAKVASDLRKPHGLTIVEAGGEEAFLAPLPIERMWGVGPKASQRVRAAGIATIGDLVKAPHAKLTRLLGREWGEHVQRLARGEDVRAVIPDHEAKTIGAEETFEADVSGYEALSERILVQSARVAQRLASQDLLAFGVTLKVKLPDFTLLSRQTTLPEPVADTVSVHRAAMALLAKLELGEAPVRLTGVSAFKLIAREDHRVLFVDETTDKRRRVEKLALEAKNRFGAAALSFGAVKTRR